MVCNEDDYYGAQYKYGDYTYFDYYGYTYYWPWRQYFDSHDDVKYSGGLLSFYLFICTHS